MASDPATAPKLKGIIEADETFIGGKPRVAREVRRIWSKKIPVFAALQRGGNVRTRAMPVVTAGNIKAMLSENVDFKSSRLMTDKNKLYRTIGPEFASGHDWVDHSVYEYARGEITTNTIEGFFSIVKRGLHGIYHAVSKEHLHRYLAEFEFRYNGRKMNDGERVTMAIKSAEGKRLLYRKPLDEAA
jgi:hypothetical protein